MESSLGAEGNTALLKSRPLAPSSEGRCLRSVTASGHAWCITFQQRETETSGT